MCRRHVASQPCSPRLHLCLSLCLSLFPPSLSKKAFFSQLSLLVKNTAPAGLCVPSLKPARSTWAVLITTSPERPHGAGCSSQYDVRFPAGRRLGAERARWLSDSSHVCLLQNPYSQATLQMLDWVYSTGPRQVVLVLSGTNAGKLSNALFCLFICFAWGKSCRGELVIDYLVGAAAKAAKARPFRQNFLKLFAASSPACTTGLLGQL